MNKEKFKETMKELVSIREDIDNLNEAIKKFKAAQH